MGERRGRIEVLPTLVTSATWIIQRTRIRIELARILRHDLENSPSTNAALLKHCGRVWLHDPHYHFYRSNRSTTGYNLRFSRISHTIDCVRRDEVQLTHEFKQAKRCLHVFAPQGFYFNFFQARFSQIASSP